MPKLEVKLNRITFKNPVLCASGCFGHGFEMRDYTDIGIPGAISMKTVTYDPRIGNPTPRICEVDSGMMTSIGLQNPGIERYVNEYVGKIKEACRPDQIIISIGGNEIDDYVRTASIIAEQFSKEEMSALEINAACPNVVHGGGAMCSSPIMITELIKAISNEVKFPLIIKINTNFSNYCDVSKAIEAAGADAIYTANTPMGMKIDISKRKPMIGNIKAPVNGPAILPQGVAKMWNIYNAVKIPVIASGGIYKTEDAIQYLMVGAAAVGIGSATFINPSACNEVLQGLKTYLKQNNIEDVKELVGCAHE